MTADDFRRLALAMVGVVESSHMNHPDFRAHGRIFATLHTNDTFGMVKVTPEEQRELMRGHPKVFVPSAGAWGRQGCTNVRLAPADEGTVRAALLLAWENAAAAAAKPRRRAKGRG
ncbi:MAG TPA: MmcQ/YjbR family DNA-binding protein [Vicinamibacterales bacterium]|nr:MmcQ/YjbR family DNA-binding protein [Vicinamibacterales bacterium]